MKPSTTTLTADPPATNADDMRAARLPDGSPLEKLLTRSSRALLAVYWTVLFIGTHRPTADLGPQPPLAGMPLDKYAHFGAFALLTLLLAYALPLGRRRGLGGQLLAAVGLAVGYGAIDELTQVLVTNRYTDWSDMLANVVGVVTTAGLLAGVVWHDTRTALWVWVNRVLLLVLVTAGVVGSLLPNPQVMPWVFKVIRLPIILPFYMEHRRAIFEVGLDKILHVLVMGVMTWVLLGAKPLGRRRRVANWIFCLAALVGSGPGVEYLQAWLSEGRNFERNDIVAHEIGVGVGVAVWFGVMLVRRLFFRTARVEAARQGGGFVGHAMTVGGLTLLSRITGLVRDSVMAATLGAGAVADAFYLAFLIPNLFRRLFGEGALAAAFIPHYTDLLKKDEELARRFSGACMGLLTATLGVLTIVGELVLMGMERHGQWSADTALTLSLMKIMLPYMPLVCLVAYLGGILQVHRRFGPPAAAPILLNLANIAAAAWIAAGISTEEGLRRTIFIVAVSVTVAGLLQLAWQVAALGGIPWMAYSFRGIGPTMRSMLRMFGPMVIALAVFQINAALDSVIAYGLAPRNGGDTLHLLGWSMNYPTEQGDVAALNWAQRLYQFPLGVFAIAIATAIFPALAEAQAESPEDAGGMARSTPKFTAILSRGLRLTFFIGLPASVGLVIIRLPLARAIFEYNQFGLDDARRVASVLGGYAAGIWAFSAMHVLTRGFYALKDVRTPLRISLTMVGLNLGLNLTLIWPLGVAGLAWSTAICAFVQVYLMIHAMRKRHGTAVEPGVWSSWIRTGWTTGAMAVVLTPATLYLDAGTLTRWQSALFLGALVGAGAAVFFAGSWLPGGQELRWLLRRDAK
ncbi:MAG: murein biosynthesis integral membrane protein MurJ [Phycisphaeraceae bacterium]|nr:murein biosynthesis integral membrane protein MurJ [Phycisphaeraceae bacterium]